MSGSRGLRTLKLAALAGTAALVLAGCTYDYLQHTDRVAYSAGNAVKANLAQETINPASRSMYKTAGLGKDGAVIPAPTTSTSATPPVPTN